MKVPEAAIELINRRAQDALRDRNLEGWIRAASDMYCVSTGSLSIFGSMESDDPFLDGIDDVVDKLHRNDESAGLDAKAVVKMYSALQQLGEKPDQFRLAMRKIRRGKESNYDWGVLIISPEGMSPFFNMVLGDNETSRIQFYKPQQQCSKHECNQLYNESRGETAPNAEVTPAIYIKPVTSQEFRVMMGGQDVTHFRDPVTGNLADPKPLMAATVQGYYSNERCRVSIPKVFFER